MKKTLILGAAFAFAASIATAQNFSLTNIFHGDSSNEGNDFIGWTRKSDNPATTDRDESKEFSSDKVSVNNRLQFDFSSEKFDGRIRLAFTGISPDGKNSSARLRGFGRFTPIEQIQFAAGNDYFTKYGVTGAYLAAADDYAGYGKAASSGLVFNTNFSGIRIIANWDGKAEVDDADALGLNFGLDLPIADVVGLGFTAKNVTSEDRTFGAFANLLSVENLTLGAGFIYNANDESYISSTKYAVQASAGYRFEDIGLTLAADVISGLSDEYVKDGETEEYKDDNNDEGIPFHAQVVAGLGVTDNVSVALDVKFDTFLGQDDSTAAVVYPYTEYKLPQNFGSVKAGVRFAFSNAAEKSGLQKVSIPLSWTWKPVNVKR